MALTFPDSPWRVLAGVLAAAAILLSADRAIAAGNTPELDWVATRGLSSDSSGVLTMNGPEVRHGTTLLRATTGTATNLEDRKNSTWKFNGDVHFEFDGAVLDAEAATVVFLNNRLSSVVVESAAAQRTKKPVRVQLDGSILDVDSATVTFVDGRISTIQALGAPAQFSHLLKKNGQRAQGRANRIDYDAGKSLIRLSVDTWFSKGSNTFATAWVSYNLADGSYSSASASGVISPDERVPAPRTPDRATAK